MSYINFTLDKFYTIMSDKLSMILLLHENTLYYDFIEVFNVEYQNFDLNLLLIGIKRNTAPLKSDFDDCFFFAVTI